MLYNDESLFVYFACFLLLVGAVFGGAFFFWILSPFSGVLVLPFYLKVLTLSLVFCFGVLSYLFVNAGYLMLGSYFFGSMWFLGYITSSPLLGLSFNLGDKVYNQELT